MLQMLMMMGDDGEKEFSAEKGIYWRTDVYGPHSDDHDHDIGDHYEVDGNDVDHDHDAKATKSAAERGIYWPTDIYDPHTGQVATQLGPSFSPMMKIKGIIHQFLATLAALDFTLVSKYCKWVGKS